MTTKYAPNDLQQAILRNLQHGHANAITGENLGKLLGLNDTRQIREEMLRIIESGIPIIGSTRPPFGYYIAETQEECEGEIKLLRSYALNTFRRYRNFKIAARPIRFPGQLSLRI